MPVLGGYIPVLGGIFLCTAMLRPIVRFPFTLTFSWNPFLRQRGYIPCWYETNLKDNSSGHPLALVTTSSGNSGYKFEIFYFYRNVKIVFYHILWLFARKICGHGFILVNEFIVTLFGSQLFYKRKFVYNNGKCSEHLENCQFLH